MKNDIVFQVVFVNERKILRKILTFIKIDFDE